MEEFVKSEPYMQDFYDYTKKVEAENFHLKRQLANKNKENKRLKHSVRVLAKKNKELEERQNRKPGYKNNRRGSKNHG